MRAAERVLAVSGYFFVASLAALVSLLLCAAFDLALHLCAGIAVAAIAFFLVSDVLRFVGNRMKRRAEYEKHFRNLTEPPDHA
jgi:uncharacterized membrane protein